jgi:catechol 2,3-dioxygenase-like lactoylglutathione lyase family enzyme
MAVSTTSLSTLSLVCIATPNVDGAISFYVDKLGFEKRTDIPFGGQYRWVEVYPPEGNAGIALAPPPEGAAVEPRETWIIFNTADIEGAHAELRERGVDVDEDISRMGDPVPPMFWIRDPDGNRLLVVQPSE